MNMITARRFGAVHPPIPFLVSTGLLLLLSSSVLRAQEHPDFSGEWVLVKEETRQPDDGRTDNMRTYIPGAEIEISSEGEKITLVYKAWDDRRGRLRESEWRTRVWLTDGESHPNDDVDRDEVVTCTWEGENLVVDSVSTIPMGFNSRTLVRRQIVALTSTPEGERLVIREWLPDSPTGGPASAHLVYRRK